MMSVGKTVPCVPVKPSKQEYHPKQVVLQFERVNLVSDCSRHYLEGDSPNFKFKPRGKGGYIFIRRQKLC